MTTVRDKGVPAIEGEVRQPETRAMRKPNVSVFVTLLCGSAMLVTAMNLAAATYLYRTSGEIRAIETRLERLAEFEKRMKDRLDLVNTGIQSQFDHLNRGLEGRFSEFHAGVDRFERDLKSLQTEIETGSDPFALADLPVNYAAEMPSAEIADAASEIEKTSAPANAAPPRRKKTTAPFRGANTAYQRIEAPDGKVYYRKVR